MKQPFEHLIHNIPNTTANLMIINAFRQMVADSNSKWMLVVRGRGLKKELANKDGYTPSRGGGTAIYYASKLSVYVRPRKIKQNYDLKYGHYK